MRRIIRRTVCTAESTAESRSDISHTFRNTVEKRNPYQSKNRSRRPEPKLAPLVSGVQYSTSNKDSESSMMLTAHASTVHEV
jgi:hypothetical protein